MQFFYLLNGWAGNNVGLDWAMRGIYLTTLPLLATLLAALLCFRPRRIGEYSEDAPAHYSPSTSQYVLASALTIAGCFAFFAIVEWSARHFLGSEILSPRPFVTHRVNALLVEPNDNSFPCIEVMLSGALAVLLYAVSRRALLVAVGAVLLHGFARIFCGTNYPFDVVFGAFIGASLAMVALGVCGVPYRFSHRRRRRAWQPRGQIVFAGLIFIALCISGAWSQNVDARFQVHQDAVDASHLHNSAYGLTAQEGEGEFPASKTSHRSAGFQTRDLPPTGVVTLGGHAPRAEKYLRDVLVRQKLNHALVSIDVAELNHNPQNKDALYRCASVRFAVMRAGAPERRAVLQTAERIIKSAFQADARLQNVDVAGVVLNRPETISDVRVYAKGAVPVFTASVERKNLRFHQYTPTATQNNWLSARSRLYFNERVLPLIDKAIPVSTHKAQPKPKAPAKTPKTAPAPTSKIRPVAPRPKIHAKPKVQTKPKVRSTPKTPIRPIPPRRTSNVRRVRRVPQPIYRPRFRSIPKRVRRYPTRPRLRRSHRTRNIR